MYYSYCVQGEKEEVSLRLLHEYNYVSVVLRQSNIWLGLIYQYSSERVNVETVK